MKRLCALPGTLRSLAPASRWLLLAALSLSTACGAYGGEVARVVDGQVQEGRFISPVSYSAYARAAQFEAQGQYLEAETAYEEALSFDPRSAEIWTRLGSVRCASGKPDADEAFEHAAEFEPEFATLWYERGRCSLERGKPAQANEQALRALALDPYHLPTTRLIVETFVRLKQSANALRYLDAAIALYPNLAALQSDKRAIVEGAGSLSERKGPASSEGAQLEDIDRALLRDATDEARQLALALGLSQSELGARATSLGKPKIALEQANQVQQADPSDGTAWVTVLSTADLLRDEALYTAVLNALDEEPTTPSALGVVLLAELLKRRVGADAAQAWLRAAPNAEPENTLVTRQRRRLERELQDGARAIAAPGQAPAP